MKISVIGMPKTGTTALYNLIKYNLKDDNLFSIFEPSNSYESKTAIKFDKENILIKYMIHKLAKCSFSVKDFDKNILIIRDPRDYIISSILYRFNDPKVASDSSKFERILSKFKQKEQQPSSISCVDLLKSFNPNAANTLRKSLKNMLQLIKELSKKRNVYIFKYEDMIDKQHSDLSDYLGFHIGEAPKPEGWTSKIARSKGYGDWINWFTAKDAAYFGESIEEFLIEHGYAIDWELSRNQEISKSTCTDYIIRLREKVIKDPMYNLNNVIDKEYIDGLFSAVDDGKNLAMYKLGRLYLDGCDVLDKDINEAFKLLDISSRLGNLDATRELAMLHLKHNDLNSSRTVFRRGALRDDIESIEGIINVIKMQNDTNAISRWKSKLNELKST